MKQLYNVQGSKESSSPLIIDKDTVYVHTNIKQLIDHNLYQYDEIQYTLEEWESVRQKAIDLIIVTNISKYITE